MHVNVRINTEREEDGRWIAEAVDFPGVMAYGATFEEAWRAVQVLTLRVLADRLEHDGEQKQLDGLAFSLH